MVRRWLTGEGSWERAGKGLACASCHGVCIIRLRRYCSGFVIDLFDRLCLPNAMNNEVSGSRLRSFASEDLLIKYVVYIEN